MKSQRKRQHFDYSRVEAKDNPREYWEYFGIHAKHGRTYIDTKRYKKALSKDRALEFIHSGLFENRNSAYFLPLKKHRYEYGFNIASDNLERLRRLWFEELRPLLYKIKNPNDLYEEYRLSAISTTSCLGDIDDIESGALIASFGRIKQYQFVIQSVLCQFIGRIVSETERIDALMLRLAVSSPLDIFTYSKFAKISNNILKTNKSKIRSIKDLDYFRDYDCLQKVNNFLKHNTFSAYEKLKMYYPNMLIESERKYETGMYSADWIKIDLTYIDSIFDKLASFYKNYCSAVLNENVDEAGWNYDDYFKEVFRKIKDLRAYHGC